MTDPEIPPLLRPGDVIQIDPDSNSGTWGALFVIVMEIEGWGVKGYFFVPGNRGEPPGQAYVRVSHGHYVRIGPAAWLME
jgi:hypothetical protein